MKWTLTVTLVFLAACAEKESGTHYDGFSYVPVVITVRVGEFGMTEGVEVRFVNQWANVENENHRDPISWAIHETLGKAVLTDSTSTATVWMRTPVGGGTNPDYYSRSLEGRILIGPEGKPWYEANLADVIDPSLRYETSQSAIYVPIRISYENAGISPPQSAESGRNGD